MFKQILMFNRITKLEASTLPAITQNGCYMLCFLNHKFMTHEEFKAKVEALSDNELRDMAQKALSKLCETGGGSFKMTVPPRVDDTDIILAELIRRFEILSFITA